MDEAGLGLVAVDVAPESPVASRPARLSCIICQDKVFPIELFTHIGSHLSMKFGAGVRI